MAMIWFKPCFLEDRSVHRYPGSLDLGSSHNVVSALEPLHRDSLDLDALCWMWDGQVDGSFLRGCFILELLFLRMLDCQGHPKSGILGLTKGSLEIPADCCGSAGLDLGCSWSEPLSA